MSEFDGVVQEAIKGDEYRNLDHHRQAPTHRVDLVSPVKGHHFLIEPLPVASVLLLQLGHLGLDLLHGPHRLVAFLGKGKDHSIPEDIW